MGHDTMAGGRNWHLRSPRDGRGTWIAIDPDGRRVTLKVVPTWDQFEREVSTLVRWSDDDVFRTRFVERAKSNPWLYGYHVAEDTAVSR